MSSEKSIIDQVIRALKKDKLTAAVSMCSSMSKEDFFEVLRTLSNAYYHKETITSDYNFDALEEIYEKKFGENQEPTIIERQDRADVRQGATVPLPIYMGGLDKIKTEHELNLWLKRQAVDSFCVEDKLDGASVLLDLRDRSNIKLYKRGREDEQEGSDVSHLVPYLDIPKNIDENIMVRGELVIPLDVFEIKYAADFKNPRNLVSGLSNPYNKTIDPSKIKDIHFVAYDLYGKEKLKPSEKIRMLKMLNFRVPESAIINRADISEENMTMEVKYRKKRSLYGLDGIVLKTDTHAAACTSGNPSNMVAFKIASETAITRVVSVEWNVSKHGLYKPTVLVEATKLCGITIERASGFNARFISENGIGKGASIVITRSNDIIPYILEVLEKVEPQLPDGEYVWNENGVELILPEGHESDAQKIARIVAFFKILGAKFLAETTITSLYEQGMTTLSSFLTATTSSLLKLDGIQQKGAERMVDSIQQAINGVPLHKIMAASSLFPGLGKKRLETIMETIEYEEPGTYSEGYMEKMSRDIKAIKGINKLASVFIDNFASFQKWLAEHPQIKIEKEKACVENHSSVEEPNDGLRGQLIVCTGWRISNELEKYLVKQGAKVSSAVSGLTTLVVSKTDKVTGKIQGALDKGIRVITKEQFLREFELTE